MTPQGVKDRLTNKSFGDAESDYKKNKTRNFDVHWSNGYTKLIRCERICITQNVR